MKSLASTSSVRIGALLALSAALLLGSGSGRAATALAAGDDDTAVTKSSRGPADRDPLVETVDRGHGRINYSAGVVKATGYGALPVGHEDMTPAQARLMALGAARADALRTLAMTVSSIQVTATTTVHNYQMENDTVETKLSALLQGPRPVSETMQPDGTAVVVVELPLYGANSVASAVFPEVLPKSPASAAADAAEKPSADANAADMSGDSDTEAAEGGVGGGAGADSNGVFHGPAQPAVPVHVVRGKAAPADGYGDIDPGVTPLSDNGPFTSVIIDCRGLSIAAIMSPKLVDTTGREVYGTVHVTPDYAIETGIVGYPRSMTEALHTARCGAHPLIIRALRAADVHRFNPVISLEDGDRILAANNRDHFLEQTRVIFLVDPLH